MVFSPKRLLDWGANRLLGTYKGVLSPKSPRQLNSSLFLKIVNNENIVDIVQRELQGRSSKLVFKTPLVVFDECTKDVAGDDICKDLRNVSKRVGEVIVDSNKYEGVMKIIKECFYGLSIRGGADSGFVINGLEKYSKLHHGFRKHDGIYAVGGGSVIDVAQYAAYKMNIPFISVPTSLANDGFASPFSVLNLKEDGVHTLKASVPFGVVVDINLIKSKDDGYKKRIRSGIGDLVSNLTAILDWEISSDDVDVITRSRSMDGAENVMRLIEEKGENIFYDDEFLGALALYLITSAEAMELDGSSRPASGFEHKVYHQYNKLVDYDLKATHGELVAAGALISAYAHGQYYDELKDVFEKVGLPVTRRQLNDCGIHKGKLKQAVRNCEGFRPERYTIFEKKGVDYMIDCVDQVFK